LPAQPFDPDPRSDACFREPGDAALRNSFIRTAIQSTGGAEVGASWFFPLLKPVSAKCAFLNDPFGIDELGRIVRTGPGTVPAPDATVCVMEGGIQSLIPGISQRRATAHARCILAVVAGQGIMEQRQSRMLMSIEGADVPPGHMHLRAVLDLAGHHTGLTAGAEVGVEGEAESIGSGHVVLWLIRQYVNT